MKALWNKLRALLTGVLIAAIAFGASTQASITYLHNDISGSPLLATNARGDVEWRENYRPYGDRLNRQPAGGNNKLWFAGKAEEPSAGLLYMGARYYSPVLGRFIGVDPQGVDSDNLHSFNRYFEFIEIYCNRVRRHSENH